MPKEPKNSILPEIPTTDFTNSLPQNPEDLLTENEKAILYRDLERIARLRREAYANLANTIMSKAVDLGSICEF